MSKRTVKSVKSFQIYQSMMLEVKLRIRAIDKFLSKDKNLAPLDAEFCFLQARKIVELICFSSIVCDQSRYKEFRKQEGTVDDKDRGNYELDWNARVILSKLKKINPNFLPIPLGQCTSNNGMHHFERSGMNVTHNKLIDIYKKCGAYLHIPNPFDEKYEVHISKQKNKYEIAQGVIQRYSEYFKNLLWNHAAIGIDYTEGSNPLELANPQNVWLIDFGNVDNDQISIIVGIAE